MSENKEIKDIKIKNINISIPNNLSFVKEDIEFIINKDEEIIEKYLERIVYTSSLSESTKIQLDKIFEKVRKDILSTI
jgi:CRISPR/Cas system CSM-associated protein Csm2 small subunit